jgi:hypothetical protein
MRGDTTPKSCQASAASCFPPLIDITADEQTSVTGWPAQAAACSSSEYG